MMMLFDILRTFVPKACWTIGGAAAAPTMGLPMMLASSFGPSIGDFITKYILQSSENEQNAKKWEDTKGMLGGLGTLTDKAAQERLQGVADQKTLGENVLSDFNKTSEALKNGSYKRTSDLLDDWTAGSDAIRTDYADRTAGIMGDWNKTAGNIGLGYQNRMDSVLGDLEGFGTQEQKDIAKLFEGERGRTTSDMVSRGLANTSTLQSQLAGVTERQSDEANRAKERVQAYKADTKSKLWGDLLGSQGQLGMFGSGLRSDLTGQELSAKTGLLGSQIGLKSGLTADDLGLAERLGTQRNALIAGTGQDNINAANAATNANLGDRTSWVDKWIASRNGTPNSVPAYASIGSDLGTGFGNWAALSAANRPTQQSSGGFDPMSGLMLGAAMSPFAFAGAPAWAGALATGANFGLGGATGYLRR